MAKETVARWTQLSVKLLQKTKVFELYEQRLRSPRNEYEDDFYFIKVVDWVNVIPLTAAGEVVLVEQFRFGVHQPSLEIPGGMLEGADDDPFQAAIRELAEETGYTAQEWEPLGWVYPNPAIQTNRCFTYLARNVQSSTVQQLDDAEDIRVVLAPLSDIPRLIQEGRIAHSLVVNAFYRFFAAETGAFARPLFPGQS